MPWSVVLNCSPERWVPSQLFCRSSLQRLLRCTRSPGSHCKSVSSKLNRLSRTPQGYVHNFLTVSKKIVAQIKLLRKTGKTPISPLFCVFLRLKFYFKLIQLFACNRGGCASHQAACCCCFRKGYNLTYRLITCQQGNHPI